MLVQTIITKFCRYPMGEYPSAILAMGSVHLLLTGYRKGILVYEKVLKDPLLIVIISPSLRPNKEQSVIPFANAL